MVRVGIHAKTFQPIATLSKISCHEPMGAGPAVMGPLRLF
jgi:hypothetical protein